MGRTVVVRGAGLLAFWVALIGADAGDLAVGHHRRRRHVVSLRLLPAGAVTPASVSLGALALRFFWQSVTRRVGRRPAGAHPRLPVRPGFVAYAVRFRRPTRNVFTTLTGLLRGRCQKRRRQRLLTTASTSEQPVAARLAAEEAITGLRAVHVACLGSDHCCGLSSYDGARPVRRPARAGDARRIGGAAGPAGGIAGCSRVRRPASATMTWRWRSSAATFASIAFVKKGTARAPDAPEVSGE
jgi:multicomponent Na+:H+ antiporter subunit E